ncbi:MAG: TolC family protein [Bacteroidetes bacterium]|nr:TolC family protein [Bacteroidota bacterium]
MRGKFLALAVCSVSWFWCYSLQAANLELELLIEEALSANPELGALKSRWEAFEARVGPAGALEDPVLKFEASNVPLGGLDFSSTSMSGKQIVLSQSVPFPGTLRAKEEAAEYSSLAAESDLRDLEGTVVNLVKQSYFTLAFVDRAIGVTENNEDLLRSFVRIAQTKYEVGQGLQQDVLKAQVSLSALKARLIRLRTRRAVTEARLNLVLNRAVDQPVGQTDAVTLTTFDTNFESMASTALESRPILQKLTYTRRSFEAKERLAERLGRPMMMFSLGYRQRDFMAFDPVEGGDFFSVGVGFTLPIYRGRKQKQMAAEARANARMTDARLEATRQQVRFNVRALLLAIDEHRREADLFRTAILPQAEQALASARAGYPVNKVDFLTLLNNQVTLLNFEIDAYRHVTEHEKKIAELEAVVGTRFNPSTVTR